MRFDSALLQAPAQRPTHSPSEFKTHARLKQRARNHRMGSAASRADDALLHTNRRLATLCTPPLHTPSPFLPICLSPFLPPSLPLLLPMFHRIMTNKTQPQTSEVLSFTRALSSFSPSSLHHATTLIPPPSPAAPAAAASLPSCPPDDDTPAAAEAKRLSAYPVATILLAQTYSAHLSIFIAQSRHLCLSRTVQQLRFVRGVVLGCSPIASARDSAQLAPDALCPDPTNTTVSQFPSLSPTTPALAPVLVVVIAPRAYKRFCAPGLTTRLVLALSGAYGSRSPSPSYF